MTSTPFVSKPVSICCACRSSRRKSPAATSAISDSATCATTSSWRSDSRPRTPRCPRDRRHQLVLQHRDDVRLRRLQRRREAEQDAGQDGQARGEGEHARIERQRGAIDREGQRQLRRDDRAQRPRGEPHAGDAAGDRQQQALGQQLTRRAATAWRRAPAGSRFRGAASAARASSRLAMLAQAISSTMPTTIISTVDSCTQDVGAPAVRVQPRLQQRHGRRAPPLVVDRERLLEIREHRAQVGPRLFHA